MPVLGALKIETNGGLQLTVNTKGFRIILATARLVSFLTGRCVSSVSHCRFRSREQTRSNFFSRVCFPHFQRTILAQFWSCSANASIKQRNIHIIIIPQMNWILRWPNKIHGGWDSLREHREGKFARKMGRGNRMTQSEDQYWAKAFYYGKVVRCGQPGSING